jgi:acyl carrier protein
MRDQWRAARSTRLGEPVAVLRRGISRELAAVLGFDATVDIAPRERYFDLGMDSLMAVELKNRLQQAFGVPLPATLAFEYPTVETLAALIDETFSQQEGSPPIAAASSAASPRATLAAPEPETADGDLESLSTDEIARLLANELDGSSNQVQEEVVRVR